MAGHLKLLLTIGLLAAAPLSAEARQGGLFGPAIEVGADVTIGLPDGDPAERRTAVGPRVTLHLTPRNSLVFFGDAVTSRVGDRSWYRTWMWAGEFRRAIYESGGFTFSGVAGAGISRHEEFTASFPSVGPGNVPIIVHDTYKTSVAPLGLFGINLEQRIGDRFSVHGDLLLVGAEDASEYRVQAGFSVPLGPYSSTRTDVSTAYGSTPLKTGRKLWATTQDGRETTGKISAIDDNRIEITSANGRVSIARGDIRQLAVPDSVMNGTGIGAGIGAVSFGAFVAWLSTALCETDACNSNGAALVGGLFGAAVGGLAGALTDSLIDGRRTVFGAGTALQIDVAPSVGRRDVGGRVQVSW